MIYHFFDEREIFSEFEGGAISRWAANVLRHQPDTHIVCSKADDSWGFAPERIHVAPRLSRYMNYRARRFYPVWLNRVLLGRLYGKDAPTLHPGDVVWVHGQPAIAAALLPRVKAAKARLVLHLHGSAFLTHTAGLLQTVARGADLLVFCSQFLEREAKGRFPHLERTTVLYNGADGQLFHPHPGGTRTEPPIEILFASRLVPEKGAHVLLDAMRLLAQQQAPVHAVICGAAFFGGSAPTPYVHSLQQNVPANVTFVGYEHGQTLAERFRASDLFCLPATYEDPFPLVTLEAMASGLPVVASATGGIPEAFRAGGGKLIAPNDARLLADTLLHLARYPGERRKLAEEARRSFEQSFSWATIEARYSTLLEAL